MFDTEHVRLGRIADKLAAARAMPVPPMAFGVEAHGFKLGAPLSATVVAEFEERHEVTLPLAYRLFVTELAPVTGPLRCWDRSDCGPVRGSTTAETMGS